MNYFVLVIALLLALFGFIYLFYTGSSFRVKNSCIKFGFKKYSVRQLQKYQFVVEKQQLRTASPFVRNSMKERWFVQVKVLQNGKLVCTHLLKTGNEKAADMLTAKIERAISERT